LTQGIAGFGRPKIRGKANKESQGRQETLKRLAQRKGEGVLRGVERSQHKSEVRI